MELSRVRGSVFSIVVALGATHAQAASHLWDFNEVFSDASGTVQFIELKCPAGANTENGLGGKDIRGQFFGRLVFLPSNVPGLTGNKHYLMATPKCAVLLQCLTPPVVPDFIIPPNSVPFFLTAGDTVRYFLGGGPYDTWAFGAVPTDGINSLNRTGGVMVNSPTNYAGVSRSLNLNTCFDADGDGFCTGACNATDCNDSDAAIRPGATEICDGLDNNCASGIDEGFDADMDTYTTCEGDCDDANLMINPGAMEVCDGVDNNCVSGVDEGFDVDMDGFKTCTGDCNDGNAMINPNAAEVCDGVDNNCVMGIDEGFDVDGDTFTTCAGDCNDVNLAINPGATEDCFDTIDNDCDGDFDCLDANCFSDPTCAALIPTMSQWGLIVLTLVLLTGGTVVFAGRKGHAARV